MMELTELAHYFDGVQWRGNDSFQCCCPAHADDVPSLTVTEASGKILMHCHAGCDTADVLTLIGLTFEDIGSAHNKPLQWHCKLAEAISRKTGEEYHFAAEYKYMDENGMYLYSKVRLENAEGKKQIRYVKVDEDTDTYRTPASGGRHTLYMLPQLIRAIKQEYPVYYVEGEKDVDTLRKLGYTATTAGGAADWRDEYAKYFIGARVIILQDNDKPGERLREQVMKSLLRCAFSVTWATTSDREHGDVTDYIQEGHSMEDVKELVRAAAAAGQRLYPPWVCREVNRQGDEKIKIHPALLAKTIEKEVDYIQLRNPANDKETVCVYENGIYKPYNNNMLNGMIGEFVPSSYKTIAVLDNTRRLLGTEKSRVRGYGEINTDDRYINFKNGLYDIANNKLIEHTPEVVYTTQLNSEYNAGCEYMPVFNKFINDLCTADGVVDNSKKALLQEWTGLLISNIPIYRVKQSLILYSPLGNTGKSQYLGLLADIVGMENTAAVELQKLSDERSNKFAVGYLYGKRINIVGDQQYTDIRSSSIFKQLTGGDPVNCEPKGLPAFSFRYSGGLVFACNDLPGFTDDKGGHVFERMCIIPCMNTIPEEKRIGNILDLMREEKPAIINWALEGLRRLIHNGYKFTECDATKEALEEYREDIDSLHRYLKRYYVITGDPKDRIKKTAFDERYTQWCLRENVQALSKRNIKKRMLKNGVLCAKYNGEFYYKGVKEIIPTVTR